MYRLFFSPEWFNGWDIIFDVVALVIALMIAGYSWRIYRINGENKFVYLSFAFLLVSLGLLFKTMTSSILYYTPVRDVAADVSHLYYRLGFFGQMVSMLGAWLLIFFISQKSRARLRKLHEVTQIALFIYLVLLISIVANFKYFVFYLTSSVLLGLIVLNYYIEILYYPNVLL